MSTLEAVLGNTALQRLRAEDGDIHGLPGTAYTSEAFLDLEYEHVFKPSWTFVGFAHDIPHPGDVTLATVAGQSIILVRNQDGVVNAFHNVCRHRGLRLIPEAKSGQQSMVCRNHGWTYNLDGELLVTPHFGGFRVVTPPGFSACDYGLRRVRCSEWRHWILVNLDGNAAPLAEHLEPLKRQLSGYDLDSLVHVRRIFSEPIEANWKLIIENYMEPYHVPFVHAATTQGQPLEDHACITDGNCVGSYVKVDNPLPRQGNGAPAVTSAPDSLDTSAHYLDLFPNFGISTFRDALIAVLMVPQSPQRTLWQLDLYFYGHMAKDSEVIDNWSNLMHAVFYEDKAIIEDMQLGKNSPVTEDGGLFSPVWETCCQHLHRLVVDAIERGEKTNTVATS